METPAPNAVNNPDDDPTVAAAVLLLIQVPPATGSVNVVDVPEQIVDGPVIEDMVMTVIGVMP